MSRCPLNWSSGKRGDCIPGTGDRQTGPCADARFGKPLQRTRLRTFSVEVSHSAMLTTARHTHRFFCLSPFEQNHVSLGYRHPQCWCIWAACRLFHLPRLRLGLRYKCSRSLLLRQANCQSAEGSEVFSHLGVIQSLSRRNADAPPGLHGNHYWYEAKSHLGLKR